MSGYYRQWILYLIAVPLFCVLYYCTRGHDGHLMDFFVGFAICAALYACLSLYWFRSLRELFPVGHFLVFMAAALSGMLIDPHLEEMAGMLYLFIPGAVVALVTVGSLLMLAKQLLMRSSKT